MSGYGFGLGVHWGPCMNNVSGGCLRMSGRGCLLLASATTDTSKVAKFVTAATGNIECRASLPTSLVVW